MKVNERVQGMAMAGKIPRQKIEHRNGEVPKMREESGVSLGFREWIKEVGENKKQGPAVGWFSL